MLWLATTKMSMIKFAEYATYDNKLLLFWLPTWQLMVGALHWFCYRTPKTQLRHFPIKIPSYNSPFSEKSPVLGQMSTPHSYALWLRLRLIFGFQFSSVQIIRDKSAWQSPCSLPGLVLLPLANVLSRVLTDACSTHSSIQTPFLLAENSPNFYTIHRNLFSFYKQFFSHRPSALRSLNPFCNASARNKGWVNQFRRFGPKIGCRSNVR